MISKFLQTFLDSFAKYTVGNRYQLQIKYPQFSPIRNT